MEYHCCKCGVLLEGKMIGMGDGSGQEFGCEICYRKHLQQENDKFQAQLAEANKRVEELEEFAKDCLRECTWSTDLHREAAQRLGFDLEECTPDWQKHKPDTPAENAKLTERVKELKEGLPCPALVDFHDGVCNALKRTRERAELAEARVEELEEQTREVADIKAAREDVYNRLDELIDENAKLRKYAKHLCDPSMGPICEKLKHGDYECTCGLDELLAEKEPT